MVTHDFEMGSALASRIMLLRRGQLAFEGTEKLTAPALREAYSHHTESEAS